MFTTSVLWAGSSGEALALVQFVPLKNQIYVYASPCVREIESREYGRVYADSSSWDYTEYGRTRTPWVGFRCGLLGRMVSCLAR